MPLVRDLEQFQFERFEGVYFWMKDGAEHVLCKVSHEALRDRSARDGADASLPDTFLRHRQRIEKRHRSLTLSCSRVSIEFCRPEITRS